MEHGFLKVQLILYIVQVCFLIGSLVFVGIAYKASLWNQEYINRVKETWSTGYITDVITEPEDLSAPELFGCTTNGYENVAGVDWYGMSEGCICTGGSRISVSARSCDVDASNEATCETTPA
jgi:hypothetical protein